MSSSATTLHVNRPGGFLMKAATSSLGAKVIMAVTGLLMVMWLVLHLAGNLAVFGGSSLMNEYAHFLKSKPELLWPMRIGLLIIVAAHIWSGLRLALLNKAARPTQYQSPKSWRQASFASRTMAISGLVVLGFIVFHLLHFTGGVILHEYYAVTPEDPTRIPEVYGMVAQSFHIPWVVGVYVIGMALVGMHLSHGIWSAIQSLGVNGPRWTPWAKRAGFVSGVALATLFAIIPLSIAARVAGNDRIEVSSEILKHAPLSMRR